MPQLDAGTTNRAELLKKWRQALGYTQKDLAAILGVSNFHICEQERHREPTTARTINHLALVYAIHSLPPDAPVSIIQDMLAPPSALRRRQRAVQSLKARRCQKLQKTRQQA
ncbi:MAG: helix-turn-helix transcriptional regulator [Deltaproteobacteria bacterium]|jgi:transcriptional regulator with XRE-family HTH domain